MAIEQVTLRITGLQALIMHSNRGMNPRDPAVAPLAKEIKAINAKGKNKTDEDVERLAALEWELALYHDAKIGPYLPSAVIVACLRKGAERTKNGKKLLAAIIPDGLPVPLEYDGPRDIPGLYDDGRFFDYRVVRVGQARVMRARPIFPQWAAQFTVIFDAQVLNPENLVNSAIEAGRYVGMCDHRPTYGRFAVEEVR